MNEEIQKLIDSIAWGTEDTKEFYEKTISSIIYDQVNTD